MAQEDEAMSCELVGFAGIIVQLTLGFLSFSVLIYKRYTEKPKRAWKIWFMDTSKQGASQFLAHIINIVISIKLSANIQSDACIWYLTTNVLDNTVGVFLCIGALSMIEKKVFEPNYTRYQSGNYYQILSEYDDQRQYSTPVMIQGDSHIRPLQITYRRIKYAISYWDWSVQFLVWNLIVVVSKTLVFLTEIGLSTPIVKISLFLIGWIQPYKVLELILVIIVVPVIMNGLAFWIQDNFLMKKDMTPIPMKEQGAKKEQNYEQEQQKRGEEIHSPLL